MNKGKKQKNKISKLSQSDVALSVRYNFSTSSKQKKMQTMWIHLLRKLFWVYKIKSLPAFWSINSLITDWGSYSTGQLIIIKKDTLHGDNTHISLQGSSCFKIIDSSRASEIHINIKKTDIYDNRKQIG